MKKVALILCGLSLLSGASNFVNATEADLSAKQQLATLHKNLNPRDLALLMRMCYNEQGKVDEALDDVEAAIDFMTEPEFADLSNEEKFNYFCGTSGANNGFWKRVRDRAKLSGELSGELRRVSHNSKTKFEDRTILDAMIEKLVRIGSEATTNEVLTAFERVLMARKSNPEEVGRRITEFGVKALEMMKELLSEKSYQLMLAGGFINRAQMEKAED